MHRLSNPQEGPGGNGVPAISQLCLPCAGFALHALVLTKMVAPLAFVSQLKIHWGQGPLYSLLYACPDLTPQHLSWGHIHPRPRPTTNAQEGVMCPGPTQHTLWELGNRWFSGETQLGAVVRGADAEQRKHRGPPRGPSFNRRGEEGRLSARPRTHALRRVLGGDA